VWFISQAIVGVFFTFWLRYRARGVEHIAPTGGGLLLANHLSFLDPMLIGLALRRPISFLARDTLFPIPFVGWMLRHTYVMPLSRDTGGAAGIRETLRRLDEGYLVGIFPEGTRSADGSLGPFKPGFAAIVRRTNIPIYPVGIAGSERALGRGSMFLKPRRVCVVFGEPIPKETIDDLRQRGREAALVEAVRTRIAACQQQAEAWLRR
jgi:1-acyl-sn-glycerol-3-phosphate acyltransferase